MTDFVVSDIAIVDATDTTAITNAIQGIPNTSKLVMTSTANGLQVIIVGYV